MAGSAIKMETVNDAPAPERLLGVIVYVLTAELVVGVPDNVPVTALKTKPDVKTAQHNTMIHFSQSIRMIIHDRLTVNSFK